MDLNKVMLIGRLTRDPELRTIPSGASVCKIGIATNYVYTNPQTGQKVEQVEFHDVNLWRKLGEIANQYLKKGRRVYIEGRLQTRSWETPEGQKRSKTEIVADNMIMLDGGNTTQNNQNTEYPVQTKSASIPNQTKTTNQPVEELPTIQQEDISSSNDVEDIPF